jgi:hypothetical protein
MERFYCAHGPVARFSKWFVSSGATRNVTLAELNVVARSEFPGVDPVDITVEHVTGDILMMTARDAGFSAQQPPLEKNCKEC